MTLLPKIVRENPRRSAVLAVVLMVLAGLVLSRAPKLGDSDQAKTVASQEKAPKRVKCNTGGGLKNKKSITDVEQLQHQQAQDIQECIFLAADEAELDVACELIDQEVTLFSSSLRYVLKMVVCIAYDEEGYPVARSFAYPGPVCNPDDFFCDHIDDVTYTSVATSSFPLNSYVGSGGLPALHLNASPSDLTEENSFVSPFVGNQGELDVDTYDTCQAAFGFLNQDTEVGSSANLLSRAVMDLYDLFERSGFEYEALGDHSFFGGREEVGVYGESDGGVPMRCALSAVDDVEVLCSPTYPGLFNEDGVYEKPAGLRNEGLVDPSCRAEGSLDDFWIDESLMDGVVGCDSGYDFVLSGYGFLSLNYTDDEVDREIIIRRTCRYYHDYEEMLADGIIGFAGEWDVQGLYEEYCE